MRRIPRVTALRGEVTVPPSKSFTARALLMAAIAEGPSRVVNALDSDDSRYMLEALRKVGFEIEGTLAKGVTILERRRISANEVEIAVGNAGTAMRFLAGFLAFTPGRFILKGETRMHQRPIGDLVDALRAVGGEIEYAGSEGFPPLLIRGKKTRGGFEIPIHARISSQFVSSLLMAGSTLPGGVDLRLESVSSLPYIDMTTQILADFGASVERPSPGIIRIRAPHLHREEYRVEADYSSASYWMAAAAGTAGTITLHGLNPESRQGDRQFVNILESMGVTAFWSGQSLTIRGPERLMGGSFDCNAAPDIVPTLAALAPLASSAVEISRIGHLRFKESDRLAALSEELSKLGAAAEEGADSLTVRPGWGSHPATIDPHNDHRIAMSFAIAGLARGNVSIADEHVVSKSYPGFWRTLDALVSSH